MRYIKKKAALLLAAVLTASSAAAVSAEENADTGAEISVDISWEEMSFTYFGGHKIWDPETHTYSTASDMWYSEQREISVANNNETSVTARLEFDTDIDGLNGDFTESVLEVGGNAEEKTYFSVSGAAIDSSTNELGVIKINILPSTNN